MNEATIPVVGTVGALSFTHMISSDPLRFLKTRSAAPYRRMAIEVADDGLDSFGLILGTYAVFREQGWPNNECQICLISFGEEATLRLIEDIFATEPTLRVSGDKIDAVQRHRNDFIVLGVLDGVIAAEFANVETVQEEFNWGC